MSRPFTRTYTPSDVDADGYVDGGTGASLTLLASSAGDGLAHKLNFTSAQNISDHTFTVVGTDADGAALTETVTGPNATTVESTKYFLTVTSITPDATLASDTVDIGWVDEFVTPTIPTNWRASMVQGWATPGGTIDYTVRATIDALSDGGTASTLNWIDVPDDTSGTIDTSDITAAVQFTISPPPTALQLQVNSYSSGATLRINTTHPQVA